MSTLLGEARVRIRPDTLGFLREAERDVARAGTSLGRTFSGAMRAGTLALGGITIAAALAAKSTLDIGIEYQNSLNTLQAVSRATASQMAAVGAVAKRLGSDISLPATSAADAAKAMTELAKGGLSVEQSMAAAKGTLQLAAAAQIDAGKAAEYQAQTLNAFHLSGDQAARVSDVLANAANAASGEISDFALGMSQASAVAAAAGIPLEDTAAALMILAKNGIMGSDAGTLLKSALLALESPSKPAKKAMDSLSLSAYDAHGNFVGLSSIFGQLAEAQKRMTPEAYAYATSTLFGSDAARLAGIAGHEGAAGYDAMAKAARRNGTASEVAAAKAKGVGGAIEALKSQVETFQIDLFERGAPNIEKLVRYAADHFPAFGNAVVNGIEHAIKGIGDFKDEAVRDFNAVADYVEPVTTQIARFVTGLDDAYGVGATLFAVLKVGGAVLIATATALHPLVDLTGELLSLFNDLPGPLKTVVLAFAALKIASKFNLLSNLGLDKTGAKAGVTGAVRGMGESVVGFGQTVRANMKIAGDDVGRFSRVMGGFSAGFQRYMPDATAAVQGFGASVRQAFDEGKRDGRFDAAERMSMSVRDLPKATGDIRGFGAAAGAAAKGGVGALRAGAGGLVDFLGGPWGVGLAAAGVAVAGVSSIIAAGAANVDRWSKALLDGGKAAQQAQQEGMNPDFWEGFWEWTGIQGDFKDAQAEAKRTYESLGPIQRAQQDVTRSTNDLAEAIDTYGKTSPQARLAADALKLAQSDLATKTKDVETASRGATDALLAQTQASLAGTNADVSASMAQLSLEQQMAGTAATIAEFGAKSVEGRMATDQLTQSALAAANTASAAAFAHSKAADDTLKHRDADAALLASLEATRTELGVNTPKAITDLIASLQGSAGAGAATAAAMADLGIRVQEIPNSKNVRINCPTDDVVKQLEDLGLHIEHVPGGKDIIVVADTKTAEDTVNEFVNRQRTIDIIANVGTKFSSLLQWGAPGHADGGHISGPGTGTSDSIPSWLSDGEYVVKAKSVAKYGLGLMDAINAGRFANGGSVGQSKALARPREEALTASRPRGTTQDAPFTYAPTFVVDPRHGSVRDQMGDAMFELRRLRRGGRKP